MPSFLSKLKSLTILHPDTSPNAHPGPPKDSDPGKDSQAQKLISPGERSTQSISPKLRTFFDPLSPRSTATAAATRLGVLESPKSPDSAYSGVALLGDVEIVRRVSKGKVKKIELTPVKAYESISAGTQTDDVDVIADVKNMLKRRFGLAKREWEMLHSGDAGLLFMSNTAEDKTSKESPTVNDKNASLPLTGNLLLKLQQAIAVDAELQACQKRTTRELATLSTHHETLHRRKEALKLQLEDLKTQPNYDLNEEKLEVDKALVRVWESSIDATDERLKCEERLEKKREEFEDVARAALAVLALGLIERGLVDVDGGRERKGSEVEFEMKYRLADR